MVRTLLSTAVILSTLLCQTLGGVVVEMVSRDLRSNQESPPDKTYVQGQMLRIEPHQQGDTAGTAGISRPLPRAS